MLGSLASYKTVREESSPGKKQQHGSVLASFTDSPQHALVEIVREERRAEPGKYYHMLMVEATPLSASYTYKERCGVYRHVIIFTRLSCLLTLSFLTLIFRVRV